MYVPRTFHEIKLGPFLPCFRDSEPHRLKLAPLEPHRLEIAIRLRFQDFRGQSSLPDYLRG